jgi:neutral ceramidase
MKQRLVLLVCMMWSVTRLGATASAQDFKVGVARVDITPDGPIWLTGYGNRNKPSEGVEQHLFAKALVLESEGGVRTAMVTADVIGFPAELTEAVAGRVKEKLGIERDRFMLVASHTHTGPVIHNSLGGMFDLKGQDLAAVEAYAKRLSDQLVALVVDASRGLEAAKLEFGHGRATFAMNRRVFRANGVQFGVNPDGAVDHDVPVLRVTTTDGRLLATVFGYACHCTTLGGDYYRICGDWAGYAQEYLELAHPGATAMFVTGCGADSNPEPRTGIPFARQNGLHMAGAVAAVVSKPMSPVRGPIRASFATVPLPFAELPSRAEFEKRLGDSSPFVQRHARRFLDMMDRSEPLPKTYPCPIQAWQFGGDLTLVAIGGEVVVDYVIRLKRELGAERLWVAGYANDVFAYVPSVRILQEGGYEAEFNLIYYGQPTRFAPSVEDTLVKAVHDQVRRVSK